MITYIITVKQENQSLIHYKLQKVLGAVIKDVQSNRGQGTVSFLVRSKVGLEAMYDAMFEEDEAATVHNFGV